MVGNIQKYLAFVKTVELGSFTKAAENLNYTQSAVSKMVAELEREWNVVLLDRDRAGLRLTADGQYMLPHAKLLCEDYQRMMQEAYELSGLQTGLIRIGTFSSVAIHWIPTIINRFQKDYPGIDYELMLGDYEEIEQWIRTDRVDCGFTHMLGQSDLDITYLDTDEWVAILPEDHHLAQKDRIPIEAFEGVSFMLVESNGDAEVADFLESHGIQPNIRIRTWDDYSIMSMVRSGMGLSILPSLIMKEPLPGLITRPLEPAQTRDIGFAVRNDRALSAVTRKFMQYLVEES